MQGHGLQSFRDQDSLQASLGRFHADSLREQGFFHQNLLQHEGLQNHGSQNLGLQNHGLQNQGLQSQGLSSHGLQTQSLSIHGLQTQGLQTHSLSNHSLQTQTLQGLQNQGAQTLGLPTQSLSLHVSHNSQGSHSSQHFLNQEHALLQQSFNQQFGVQPPLSQQQQAVLGQLQVPQPQLPAVVDQFDDSKIMNDLLKDYGVREHTISR